MDAFKKFTGGNTQTTGATGTNPQQPGEKKDLGDKSEFQLSFISILSLDYLTYRGQSLAL